MQQAFFGGFCFFLVTRAFCEDVFKSRDAQDCLSRKRNRGRQSCCAHLVFWQMDFHSEMNKTKSGSKLFSHFQKKSKQKNENPSAIIVAEHYQTFLQLTTKHRT